MAESLGPAFINAVRSIQPHRSPASYSSRLLFKVLGQYDGREAQVHDSTGRER